MATYEMRMPRPKPTSGTTRSVIGPVEIVGAKIGSRITNRPKEIIAALKADTPVEFLSRDRMEFMAACDLGPQWAAMAESPTLFKFVDGKPEGAWPNRGDNKEVG